MYGWIQTLVSIFHLWMCTKVIKKSVKALVFFCKSWFLWLSYLLICSQIFVIRLWKFWMVCTAQDKKLLKSLIYGDSYNLKAKSYKMLIVKICSVVFFWNSQGILEWADKLIIYFMLATKFIPYDWDHQQNSSLKSWNFLLWQISSISFQSCKSLWGRKEILQYVNDDFLLNNIMVC